MIFFIEGESIIHRLEIPVILKLQISLHLKEITFSFFMCFTVLFPEVGGGFLDSQHSYVASYGGEDNGPGSFVLSYGGYDNGIGIYSTTS
jgi:hypothetical protein